MSPAEADALTMSIDGESYHGLIRDFEIQISWLLATQNSQPEPLYSVDCMAQPCVSLRRLCRFPLHRIRPSICSRLPPSAHIHTSRHLLRKKTQDTEQVFKGLDSDAFTNDIARGVCGEWSKFSKLYTIWDLFVNSQLIPTR